MSSSSLTTAADEVQRGVGELVLLQTLGLKGSEWDAAQRAPGQRVEVYRDDISVYGKHKKGHDVITPGRYLKGSRTPSEYRKTYTVRSTAVAFKVYHCWIWLGSRSAQALFFENLDPSFRMFLKRTLRDVKEHRNNSAWELWLEEITISNIPSRNTISSSFHSKPFCYLRIIRGQ